MALSMVPSAIGSRIVMVTNRAYPYVTVTGEIIQRELKLAEYSEKTKKELREQLPSYAQVGNPVDLTGSATARAYEISMRSLL